MKRQIAVIGIGKFGSKTIQALSKKGVAVIAIDKNHDRVEKIKDFTTEALQIDTLDKESLAASGVKDVDAVIVALGNDVESSILITAMLREMGVKEIVARAKSHLHERILNQVGATRVVFPEEDMALRVANTITQPGIHEYIELGGEFDLAEIEIKEGHCFIGNKLIDIEARKKYNVNLVMIKKLKKKKDKEGIEKIEESKQLPYVDYKVVAGDILVVVGDRKNIEKFGEVCEA